MLLSVHLLPESSRADVVVVIDVLRFTSSAAYALANGARSIIPCTTVDDARSAVPGLPSALLAGERNAVKPDGFDLGNSPREFTSAVVQGRDIIWTTTNGTTAIAVTGAAGVFPIPLRSASTRSPSPSPRTPHSAPSQSLPRDLILASYVNCAVVVAALEFELRAGASIAVVCSGREGGFALEDAACAGRLVRRLRASAGDVLILNDGARASACIDEAYGEDFPRLFRDAQHGRFLRDRGFGADLEACGALDAVRVVPRARRGRFVAG
ncbi:MAG TPA: 2-phosphosulfolactate phosphatase [Gemmatimonadaceae bacterium]